jgi:hypothetical protein
METKDPVYPRWVYPVYNLASIICDVLSGDLFRYHYRRWKDGKPVASTCAAEWWDIHRAREMCGYAFLGAWLEEDANLPLRLGQQHKHPQTEKEKEALKIVAGMMVKYMMPGDAAFVENHMFLDFEKPGRLG